MDQFIEFAINNWILFLSLMGAMLLLAFTEGKKGGKNVSIHDATRMINKESAVIIDIRNKNEFKTGHIISSINIPSAEIDKRMDELEIHKEKPIIVVCNLGQTSAAVAKKLHIAGYENVTRMKGGITEWKGQNLPVVKK